MDLEGGGRGGASLAGEGDRLRAGIGGRSGLGDGCLGGIGTSFLGTGSGRGDTLIDGVCISDNGSLCLDLKGKGEEDPGCV